MDFAHLIYLLALGVCIGHLLWGAWRDVKRNGEVVTRGYAALIVVVAAIPAANAIYAGCLIVYHGCRLTGVTLDHVQDWFEGPLFRKRRQ